MIDDSLIDILDINLLNVNIKIKSVICYIIVVIQVFRKRCTSITQALKAGNHVRPTVIEVERHETSRNRRREAINKDVPTQQILYAISKWTAAT